MSTKRNIYNKSLAQSVSYARYPILVSSETRNCAMSTTNSSFARSSKDFSALLASNRSNGDLLEKNCFGVPVAAPYKFVKRAPRLHINVGGRHFEVARPLLARHPTTRLGRLALLIDGDRAPHAEELLELCDDFGSLVNAAPTTNISSNETCNAAANETLQKGSEEGPVFYFERDSTALPMLLSYYRTGRLHISEDMCTINFAEELEYWNIDSVNSNIQNPEISKFSSCPF